MRHAATLLLLAVAGCGGGDDEARLTVSAAASLKPAFEEYARGFDGAEVRFSFAGSDELAAQIRRGARPDVYAAANTRLPEALRAEGLVEEPAVFATNRLVLAVPASSDVDALADVAEPGVSVAIGSDSVPVGSYTREVLARLDRGQRDGILANVRTNEPDVASIVGKLTQGAVDAGFVYATDVRATGGALRAIELPGRVRPDVAYAAAVVVGAGNGAREFVRELPGAPALERAGFGRR